MVPLSQIQVGWKTLYRISTRQKSSWFFNLNPALHFRTLQTNSICWGLGESVVRSLPCLISFMVFFPELSPDNLNSCVSSCSQTDVEQSFAEASSHDVELSRQEPNGVIGDGSQLHSECDVDKNDPNIFSCPSRVEGDCTSETDYAGNSDGQGPREDGLLEVGATTLTGKKVDDIQMDVENPPGEVLTTPTESDEALIEGCKDQVEVENHSKEVSTSSPECDETLFDGCEDQVAMDVENTYGEIESVPTKISENLCCDLEVRIEIDVENTLAGKDQTIVSEFSKTLSREVQVDVEKVAGEVPTCIRCSDSVCNGCENRLQTDVKSSSNEQTMSPVCVEKLFESCEDEVQINVEITSEDVQTTASTECSKNSFESCENDVLVNVESVTEKPSTAECNEKSLGSCEGQVEVDEESCKTSIQTGPERVDVDAESTPNDANNPADAERSPSKDNDTAMNLSVSDFALLALDDSGSIKVKDIMESIDAEDLLLSYDDIPEVLLSDNETRVCNTSSEGSCNVSSDIEIDITDTMLSQILEEEDINGIFQSTLSSQESDSDNDSSDSDRLFIDYESPQRVISGTAILPNEQKPGAAEELEVNDQTSTSGDTEGESLVTGERLNLRGLSTNLLNLDEIVEIGGCERVEEKVDAKQPRKVNAPLSPKKILDQPLNSELRSDATTDDGSRADDLEEQGKDEVKLDLEKSDGMTPKIVVRNGALFVPSRLAIKRVRPIVVESNPTPSFDVVSVWQAVKKRAMGMNAKPDT